MAEMFEREVTGFTEEFEAAPEPGVVPEEPEEAAAPEEGSEEAPPEA